MRRCDKFVSERVRTLFPASNPCGRPKLPAASGIHASTTKLHHEAQRPVIQKIRARGCTRSASRCSSCALVSFAACRRRASSPVDAKLIRPTVRLRPSTFISKWEQYKMGGVSSQTLSALLSNANVQAPACKNTCKNEGSPGSTQPG